MHSLFGVALRSLQMTLIASLLLDIEQFYSETATLRARAANAEEMNKELSTKQLASERALSRLQEGFEQAHDEAGRDAHVQKALTELLRSELAQLQLQSDKNNFINASSMDLDANHETVTRAIKEDVQTRLRNALEAVGYTYVPNPHPVSDTPVTRSVRLQQRLHEKAVQQTADSGLPELCDQIGALLSRTRVLHVVEASMRHMRSEHNATLQHIDILTEEKHTLHTKLRACQDELQRLRKKAEEVQTEYLCLQEDHATAMQQQRLEAEARYESMRAKMDHELNEQVEEMVLQAAAFETRRDILDQELQAARQLTSQVAAEAIRAHARAEELVSQKGILHMMMHCYEALSKDVTFLALSCVPKSVQAGTPGARRRKFVSDVIAAEHNNHEEYEALEFSPAVMHRLHRLSGAGGYGSESINVYEYPTVSEASRGPIGAMGKRRRYSIPALRTVAIFLLAALRMQRVLFWIREQKKHRGLVEVSKSEPHHSKADTWTTLKPRISYFDSFYNDAVDGLHAHLTPIEQLEKLMQGRTARDTAANSSRASCIAQWGSLLWKLTCGRALASVPHTGTSPRRSLASLYASPAHMRYGSVESSAGATSLQVRPVVSALPYHGNVFGAPQISAIERSLIFMSSKLMELRHENAAFAAESELLAQRQMQQAHQLLLQEHIYQRQTPAEAMAMSAMKATYDPQGRHRDAGVGGSTDASGESAAFAVHDNDQRLGESQNDSTSSTDYMRISETYARNVLTHKPVEQDMLQSVSTAGSPNASRAIEDNISARNDQPLAPPVTHRYASTEPFLQARSTPLFTSNMHVNTLQRADAAVYRLAGHFGAEPSLDAGAGPSTPMVPQMYSTPAQVAPRTRQQSEAWTQGHSAHSDISAPPLPEAGNYSTPYETSAFHRSQELDRLRHRLQAPLDTRIHSQGIAFGTHH